MSCWNFRGGRRLALVLSIAAASLAGCGGGDDGTDPELYVSWENNANGTVIVDWNNDRYAVRRSDRVVVSLQDMKALTGMSVDVAAQVWASGVVVASVSPGLSTTGTTIAVFKCSGGRTLNITETSTSYSQACV